MKKIVFGIILFPTLLFAQTTDKEKELRAQTADTTLGWKKGGVINIGLSQTSLTNWAAGGQNSVAVNGILSAFLHKKTAKALWENYLDLGYGILRQGKVKNWWKTDDKIDFTSKYGVKVSKSWYGAALLNFKTQMTEGFNYPNDSIRISNILAPGYLLAALGLDFKPKDNFSAFIAPLTGKVTFVQDERLADAGAFGVENAIYDATGNIVTHGKMIRSEFGGYLRILYKTEIMKNVGLQTKVDLFSNYMNNPGNIDVNWETLISLKVNKFLSATITTHLIYDDDIDIAVDNNNDGIIDEFGPRTQFKEVLNVGFSYKF